MAYLFTGDVDLSLIVFLWSFVFYFGDSSPSRVLTGLFEILAYYCIEEVLLCRS
jgi:hypothetical protein